MKNFIIIMTLLHAAFAAPQFITFKDGQIGVNFAGYHAEAGLGGGRTGNGVLGGLSASAGTPHGQNAAAGLGGNVNGRTAGVLYAGAEATPDIGASAILGGDVGRGGFSGAESHGPRKVTSRTRTTVVKEIQPADEYVTETVTTIQKIRPPKKFHQTDDSHNHSLHDGVGAFVDTSDISAKSNLPSISPTTPNVRTKNVRIINSASESSSEASSLLSLAPSSPAIHNYASLTSNSSNHGINVVVSHNQGIDPTATPSAALTHSNENNLNSHQNDKTTVTINKTKYRIGGAHPHRIRHQQRKLQRRLNATGHRQHTKTIVQTVNQKQRQQLEPQTTPQQQQQQQQQQDQTELVVGTEQQTHPQNPPHQNVYKTYEKRTFLAPTESVYVSEEPIITYRPVVHRQRHVVDALQIPVGILQSLQDSLGR